MNRSLKKRIGLLLCLPVLVAALNLRAAAAEILLGDVNADGHISIGDVARLYAHFQGNSLVGQDAMKRADLDNCGWLYPSYVQRLYDQTRRCTFQELVAAVFQLPENTVLRDSVTLTGTVVAVNDGYNPEFNNITVTIRLKGTEETVRCYRMTGDRVHAICNSDTITVTGQLQHYQGQVEFAAGCQGTINRPVSTAESYNELEEELISYLPVGVSPRL